MNDKYSWTWHADEKMKYYKLSRNRVKRVIRAPERAEEGIVENTVAAMQTAGAKRKTEIWVMYKLIGCHPEAPAEGSQRDSSPAKRGQDDKSTPQNDNKIRIITAWRYPGVSPKRNPVPPEILAEIKELL